MLPSILNGLRTSALAVAYTLPMLLLFTPVQIPSRFLWSGIAEHRNLADFVLLAACPALVWLVQTFWHPIGVLRNNQQGESIVSLSVGELWDATNGFSDRTLLGSGGFSAVHGTRGRLGSLSREGRCAVKRLNDSKAETHKSLRREIVLLGKCRHECLLPLLGYCLDSRALCLVYPLLEGGSLDERLHRPEDAIQRIASLQRVAASAVRPLGWRDRLRILRDAARALVYLHTRQPVSRRMPSCFRSFAHLLLVSTALSRSAASFRLLSHSFTFSRLLSGGAAPRRQAEQHPPRRPAQRQARGRPAGYRSARAFRWVSTQGLQPAE